jgi:hypothetical protein
MKSGGSVRPIKITRRATFLKRHKRLMTFVGALIVFITFIVNDAIRDELKGTVDDQKAAEAMFFDWNKQDDTDQSLNDVEARLDAIEETIRPRSKSVREDMDRKSKTLLNHLRRITARTKRVLELTTPLVDHLPQSEQTQFSDLERRLDALQKREADASIKLGDPAVTAGKFGDIAELRIIHPLMLEGEQLWHDASNFPMDALLTFVSQKNHDARRYKQWTWISWGLYSLGWSLGLIGQLYGGGEIVGED